MSTGFLHTIRNAISAKPSPSKSLPTNRDLAKGLSLSDLVRPCYDMIII